MGWFIEKVQLRCFFKVNLQRYVYPVLSLFILVAEIQLRRFMSDRYFVAGVKIAYLRPQVVKGYSLDLDLFSIIGKRVEDSILAICAQLFRS